MLRIVLWLWFVPLCLAGIEDPEWDQYTASRGDYAASHILVAYQTAKRAPESITRNKPEALERANLMLAKVLADPSSFEKLAREESDGPTAVQGGNLGVGNWGRFDAKFEKAVKQLKPGEITSKPVLTEFGYHVIRRDSLFVKNYSAKLLVIVYRGADNVDGIPYRIDNRKQSKEDARNMIDEIAAMATPNNFAELIEKRSDYRKPEGMFGNFKRSDSVTAGLLVPALEQLPYNNLTGVIELPFGFAIAQRIKVQKLAGARILITYKDAKNAAAYMTRSKEEARQIAEDLLKEVLADPEHFDKFAKRASEGMYKGTGGVMPIWLAGDKEPVLDQNLLKLSFGQICSELIDLDVGWAIFKRLDPAPLDATFQ